MTTTTTAPTARPTTTRVCTWSVPDAAGNDVEAICGDSVARNSALCSAHEEVREARLSGAS